MWLNMCFWPKQTKIFPSMYILPPAKENIKLELILSVRKRGNFGNGAFKGAPCTFHCHYTNFSVRSWVNLGDDGSRPMKWSRVEFSQDYGVSDLHIRGRLMPSLTGLKLVNIVSWPPLPKILQLLLKGLPSLQSVWFHGSVVNGRELGQRLPDEKMSRGQERAMRIVVKRT